MQVLKKILSTSQLGNTDDFTIKSNNITSLELMENAANSFMNAMDKMHYSTKKIAVICGTGNNGGDGFAICRLLRNKGVDVKAALVKCNETLSKDCRANLNLLDDFSVLLPESELPDFSNVDLIIDGIFGTGLTRPVTGFVAKVIEAINNSGKVVYSIDVPSGLNCDGISNSEYIIESDHVITFQRPKLSFFFPENGAYVRNWVVVGIGLDETWIQEQNSTYFVLDESIRNHVKIRQIQSHKGTYGHALLVAGSYGKMGAAVLSAKACLKSGTGLLTTHVPKCGYEIMQISAPEAMCSIDENLKILTEVPELKQYNSVGIGPGIGKSPETVKLLETILRISTSSLVLDADALNILAENTELLKLLPQNTILTPHIKEFDRLVGESINTPERLKKQREFAKKHKVIVVLKDANTCVSSVDGKQFFNTSGNPGMATGGSGDVLTGIITGLLAQNYEPLHAALIAVYFHGAAGDRASAIKGYNALIASDICDHLFIERIRAAPT
jgi:NAD(P)H-hydrate epimerase